MNGAIAICKKELRSYFLSPLAWVVLGIFSLVMGIIFTKFVLLYNQYNAAQRFGGAPQITLDKMAQFLYQNMSFILLIITPFLTVRLFAEEKRQQTMELLQTAPIRGWEIVVGKFASAMTMVALLLVVSFVYALFMIVWGNPDINIIATTYLGLFLSMSCYVSLGMFFSSITSSQVIAMICTFISLIMLWLCQSLGQGVTATLGPIEWGPSLVYLSPLAHTPGFGEGLIELKAIVYFVTFAGLWLFFTHKVVESNRWR